jgi:uncharacterized protein YecA (UPF0149 family)
VPVRVHTAPVAAQGPVARGPVQGPVSAAPVAAARPAGSYTNVRKDVGRNEPCPCGRGKKFKNCCGR